MRIRALLLASLLAAVTVGCGDGKPVSSPSASADTTPQPPTGFVVDGEFVDDTGKEAIQIDAKDNVFRDKLVDVSTGTTITFRNDGRNQHDLVPLGEAAFDEVKVDDFEPGTETKITFDDPGYYAYYCSLHGTAKGKGMVGVVRVEA
jgi:plastocyanin